MDADAFSDLCLDGWKLPEVDDDINRAKTKGERDEWWTRQAVLQRLGFPEQQVGWADWQTIGRKEKITPDRLARFVNPNEKHSMPEHHTVAKAAEILQEINGILKILYIIGAGAADNVVGQLINHITYECHCYKPAIEALRDAAGATDFPTHKRVMTRLMEVKEKYERYNPTSPPETDVEVCALGKFEPIPTPKVHGLFYIPDDYWESITHTEDDDPPHDDICVCRHSLKTLPETWSDRQGVLSQRSCYEPVLLIHLVKANTDEAGKLNATWRYTDEAGKLNAVWRFKDPKKVDKEIKRLSNVIWHLESNGKSWANKLRGLAIGGTLFWQQWNGMQRDLIQDAGVNQLSKHAHIISSLNRIRSLYVLRHEVLMNPEDHGALVDEPPTDW